MVVFAPTCHATTALLCLASASRGTVVTASASSSPPLVIVGAGVLGRLAAEEWKRIHGDDCEVIGVTRSPNPEREASMRDEGITPMLRADIDASGEKWPYILFCAAPGGNDDYPGTVASALSLWDKSAPKGRFVFTSSAGVYAEDQGGVVVEDSPVADSPRAAKLLAAEAKVLQAGGAVTRLAGLYLIDRGAHNFWLSQKEVAQRSDGLINQVHYRDAADCAVAALLRGSAGEVYVAADDKPLTREQICVEALKAPYFSTKQMPKFTGTDGGVGKVLDSSKSRAAIGWEPTYKTFGDFIATTQYDVTA